jgi:DNA-binding MarR family transcriptional regulator
MTRINGIIAQLLKDLEDKGLITLPPDPPEKSQDQAELTEIAEVLALTEVSEGANQPHSESAQDDSNCCLMAPNED